MKHPKYHEHQGWFWKVHNSKVTMKSTYTLLALCLLACVSANPWNEPLEFQHQLLPLQAPGLYKIQFTVAPDTYPLDWTDLHLSVWS
jgi:hypothetical protein